MFKKINIKINPHVDFLGQEQVIQCVSQDSDYYFNQKIIKDDLATTVVDAVVGQKNMIIKRINAQNIFTVLRRIFDTSRVERNWKYAHFLTQHGIDTFIPVMLVKKKCWGVCVASYLYMSKINGILAATYFEEAKDNIAWKEMADKIIALIKKLNELGIRHRDLNLSNIIVDEKNKPYLIDLDAMKRDAKTNNVLYKREINKFLENIDFLKKSNLPVYNYFYNTLKNEYVI